MKHRHLIVLLFAACTFGQSASAASDMLPGTACSSDGVTDKSVTGLMVNRVTGAANYTYFHCPFVRSGASGLLPATITVWINARTIHTTTPFKCTVRVVTGDNGTFDQVDLSFAAGASSGSYDSIHTSLSLPPEAPGASPATVNMRCQVPNTTSATAPAAGIVSYGILP